MKAIALFALLFLAIDCQASEPRNMKERYAFMKMELCPQVKPHKPGTCPGYTIDHDVALRCARTPEERVWLDNRWNMNWMTKEAALAKDKTEGNCGWRSKK